MFGILFPEGTRNATAAPLLPFKSGLDRLARANPAIKLVPVWIDNLNRVMPKGEFVSVPLLCTGSRSTDHGRAGRENSPRAAAPSQLQTRA